MYALIIAGGEGERLRPLTSDRPKPMLAVAGKPILEHQVEWLRGQGVSDIVMCCGYRYQAIEEHFGDGSRWGLRIHYSVEREPLGRGGALKQGYELLPPGEEAVIGLNGDVLTDQPLAPMLGYHRRKGGAATVMLVRLRSPFGIVQLERGGRIRAFAEKPRLPHWMNAGIYVLSPGFFQRLPDKGDHETTTFPELAAEGQLFGFRSQAYWRTIDTVKDLSEAEAEIGGVAPA